MLADTDPVDLEDHASVNRSSQAAAKGGPTKEEEET